MPVHDQNRVWALRPGKLWTNSFCEQYVRIRNAISKMRQRSAIASPYRSSLGFAKFGPRPLKNALIRNRRTGLVNISNSLARFVIAPPLWRRNIQSPKIFCRSRIELLVTPTEKKILPIRSIIEFKLTSCPPCLRIHWKMDTTIWNSKAELG